MELCLFIGNNLSDTKVTKIMIVFYSRYGNTARMPEEIAYGAKELDGIAVTLKRIADDIPIEVVSKDPSWSKIVEHLNYRIPTTLLEDIMHNHLDITQ
jgi:NAD(P)H dehydrogenase (quinone)